MKKYSYDDYKKPMFQNKKLYKSLISNFYRNSALVIMYIQLLIKIVLKTLKKWLNQLKNLANLDIKTILVGINII